jgi:hypothetical protein
MEFLGCPSNGTRVIYRATVGVLSSFNILLGSGKGVRKFSGKVVATAILTSVMGVYYGSVFGSNGV